MFYQYKKNNTSFLESITILGNEFKLKPGIFVYNFTIDNPERKAAGNGCEMPFTYKVSKMFEKKTNGESGIFYFVEGESYADFSLDFTKKNSDKIIAKYYFYITFTSPLKVAEGC